MDGPTKKSKNQINGKFQKNGKILKKEENTISMRNKNNWKMKKNAKMLKIEGWTLVLINPNCANPCFAVSFFVSLAGVVEIWSVFER